MSTVAAEPEMKLDLGCGPVKPHCYVGMDIHNTDAVDVVHDFNVIPYPFADNTFDEVRAFNSLEQVDDFMRTINELHRILKPGGRLKVLSPHFSGCDAYRDPTHRVFFAYTTFDNFTGEFSYHNPHSGKFRVVRRNFGMPDGAGRRGLSSVFKAFGNRYPDLYERYLCWMMPAKAIYFELEALKAQ